MIKCSVITTSRADYGILRSLLFALTAADDFELLLYVSGSHIEATHGNTITEIEQDGFSIAAIIPLPKSTKGPKNIVNRMAQCASGFSDIYEKDKPDLIIALGDRYEMFAAVYATIPFNIPVAHIHGGELSYGAQDEYFRHAITKLSNLHFATTQTYVNRIIQMGENPNFVFNVGSLAVGGIQTSNLLSKAELCATFSLHWKCPPILVTVHPETHSSMRQSTFIEVILQALDSFERTIIFTHPNADCGGNEIRQAIEKFAVERLDAFIVPNFGAEAFYSMLHHAGVMVGNSSSGILETASVGLPTVNIGNRQAGRVRCSCIIDVEPRKEAIENAIKKALSDMFLKKAKRTISPYGDGTTAAKIIEILRNIPNFQKLIVKEFWDL